MLTFKKDPNAILDYSVDWTSWLQTDETIVSSSWIIPSGLTKTTDAFDDKYATAWLTGGTEGETYTITNRITTNNVPPRTDDRSMNIFVTNR